MQTREKAALIVFEALFNDPRWRKEASETWYLLDKKERGDRTFGDYMRQSLAVESVAHADALMVALNA